MFEYCKKTVWTTKITKVKRKMRWLLRIYHDRRNRLELKNTNFSLLSSNCTGGVIYHALGLNFRSPTINAFLSASDFIKFLKNPNYYIEGNISQKTNTEYQYPLVLCEDITIHAVHYSNVEEFEQKWRTRGKRINWNNLFIIMSERDGCSYEDIEEFDRLPYKNKVIFVHRPMPEIKSACYIPGTEIDGNEGHWIRPLTEYQGKFTGMRYIDLFDYVAFFNDGIIRLKRFER